MIFYRKMMNEDVEKEALYVVFPSTTYKKELKKYKKQPQKLEKINEIVDILIDKGVEGLPEEYRPHVLIGKYKGSLECHIESNLLLVWTQNDETKEIILQRVGTHSELF